MNTLLTDENYAYNVARIEGGVCLFFKKLCPHCKNMEKVLEKFHALEPTASLFRIDIEENSKTASICEVLRAPTLLIIKQGNVVGKKAGLMNPRELFELYRQSN